ncbi:hypothetical protein NQ315_017583 [Exocentrus adspersus]|uniref:DUF5641 domain-containing protein n=1 Tax=Exocentrus adspersus TaxID=1586481 RepID=A0AAV8VJH7_9CUCU|nr:hypothetical protein NQ315_017583 [Exocentrus adspersus]
MGKDYSDRKRKATENDIELGNKVYVENAVKENKLTSNFNPTPHTVLEKRGNDVSVQNDEIGQKYRRNVIHLKKMEGEWKVIGGPKSLWEQNAAPIVNIDDINIPTPLPEEKVRVFAEIIKAPNCAFFKNFSNLSRLQRVVAYMLRFLHNTKPNNIRLSGRLTIDELWIISGNREIKRNIHKCVACFRAKAHCSKQLMGSLPENRVIAARQFKNVGVDFCGPYSPVFGGLWKAGVESAKFHMKRVLGNSAFTYEQFNTIIIQIEGILNSRPITQITSDPSDLTYLTPGHFLIGAPITSYPEPDVTNIPENRLKFWKLCTQAQQNFWKRWHKDYLAQLQSKPKWRQEYPNIKENMLVLLKEDGIPCLKWPMARIIKTIAGKDGKVRVVQVQTKNGIYTRSITKLAILPIS